MSRGEQKRNGKSFNVPPRTDRADRGKRRICRRLAAGPWLGLLFRFPELKDGLEGHFLEVVFQKLAGIAPNLIGSAGGYAVAEILVVDAVDQSAGTFQGLQDLADRNLGGFA
jgi:hypothetical protein